MRPNRDKNDAEKRFLKQPVVNYAGGLHTRYEIKWHIMSLGCYSRSQREQRPRYANKDAA